MDKNLNRHYTKKKKIKKRKTEMVNKHIKRCLTSLVIRERQINNTMTFLSTPIRVAKIKNKKLTISGAGEDGKQLKLGYSADGSTKCTLWKTVQQFLKSVSVKSNV